jgi:GTP-binding protein Era
VKVGYVGIIGRPNVGKSTLINNFLKFKLSIISPKPQTTRHKILGILTGENYQVIFLDTPGFIEKTKYELHKIMVKRALETMDDADLLVLMVEPHEPEEGDLILLEELKRREKPSILAINKVDTVKKVELLPLIDQYSKLYSFLEIIPISALKLINTDVLLEKIIENLKEGEPFYPDDMLTDRPERFFVAEIIREKLFNFFGEEIPYATAVTIEEFREGDKERGGKDYISAVIYVEKDSQKAIVIGKGGKALKRVGTAARKEIEAFLGRPIYLEIWVKTKPKWRKDKRLIRELGY